MTWIRPGSGPKPGDLTWDLPLGQISDLDSPQIRPGSDLPNTESYITSCVKNWCTVGDSSIDISSAGSIYNYYCSSLGFAVNAPAITTQKSAQTTKAGPSTAAAPMATATSSLISEEITVCISCRIHRICRISSSKLSHRVSHAAVIPTISSSELPLPSSSTSASSSTTTSTSTTSGTPIPAATPAPVPSNNAGAIAGGIVGAIAGLAIIAAILFFLIRTMRRREGGHITALSPMSIESSRMQQQQPYKLQQQDADRYIRPSEPTAAGPFGSPAPMYSLNAPPPADAKAGTEVYETGPSPLTSLIGPTYEVSGEHWKD